MIGRWWAGRFSLLKQAVNLMAKCFPYKEVTQVRILYRLLFSLFFLRSTAMGLKQDIQNAKSVVEIAAHLRKGATFTNAADDTTRKWGVCAAKRAEELSTIATKKKSK